MAGMVSIWFGPSLIVGLWAQESQTPSLRGEGQIGATLPNSLLSEESISACDEFR